MNDKKVQLVAKRQENEKRAAADAIQAVAALTTSAAPGDKAGVKVKKRNTVTGAEVNKAATLTAPKEAAVNGGTVEERKKKRNTAPASGSVQTRASTLPANAAVNGMSVTDGAAVAEPNQVPVHINGESVPVRKTTKSSKRNSSQTEQPTIAARQSSVTEQQQQQLETRPGSLSVSSAVSDEAQPLTSPTGSKGKRPSSAAKPAKVNGNSSKSSNTLPEISPIPDVQLIEATPTKVNNRASTATSPTSPTISEPKTPNSAFGDEMVTTFMSTPLDEANYGGGGSWARLSQAAEQRSPAASSVQSSASLHTPQRPVTVALSQSESLRVPVHQQQLSPSDAQYQQQPALRRATSPTSPQQQTALGQRALTGSAVETLV